MREAKGMQNKVRAKSKFRQCLLKRLPPFAMGFGRVKRSSDSTVLTDLIMHPISTTKTMHL
jgi:hypothetical protein